MKLFFKGSSYDTPKDKRRFLMDRLALNTRWFFAAGVLGIVEKARRLANKGVYDTKAWVETSYDVVKLIEGCGGKFHLRGLENIASNTEPVIFIGNHMSTLETFVLPCLIAQYKEATFVVKDSLVKHPIFGPIMRAREPIVVSRDNAKNDLKIVMGKGQELLGKGTSVIIFPQSTRSTTFDPEKFNSLGIKLAKVSGVKVVPVALKTDFWGNGKYFKELGPISREKQIFISFGQPFSIEGSGKEEHKLTVDFIQTHLQEWNSIS